MIDSTELKDMLWWECDCPLGEFHEPDEERCAICGATKNSARLVRQEDIRRRNADEQPFVAITDLL